MRDNEQLRSKRKCDEIVSVEVISLLVKSFVRIVHAPYGY